MAGDSGFGIEQMDARGIEGERHTRAFARFEVARIGPRHDLRAVGEAHARGRPGAFGCLPG